MRTPTKHNSQTRLSSSTSLRTQGRATTSEAETNHCRHPLRWLIWCMLTLERCRNSVAGFVQQGLAALRQEEEWETVCRYFVDEMKALLMAQLARAHNRSRSRCTKGKCMPFFSCDFSAHPRIRFPMFFFRGVMTPSPMSVGPGF